MIFDHILYVNKLIQRIHVCEGCEDGFWIGIGIESKLDWRKRLP